MATRAAEAVGLNAGKGAFAALADRWIWTFMAALFFATVLPGFVPDSINMMAAVDAGERPAAATGIESMFRARNVESTDQNSK